MAARVALGAVATAAVVLSSVTASASPESDAYDAITSAWEAAGGDASEVGAPDGDVYPVGAGFAQNFDNGKMFFTPETGARAMYGSVLEKYESIGGPADSDLGFPNIDEVAGLVSSDSRMVTFAGPDHPVIFFTPEHGAHVVRGAMNAAWDKLDSSTGPLGVPVDDESHNGDVVTQKFSEGELSWNSQTKTFTSVPPEIAAQLTDVNVEVGPASAITQAWQATGGEAGPLGAMKGEQYEVGTDGMGQDFAGGKIYFSPATGAAAVEGDILAKYESLGGPVGSDLGFPVGNEDDGALPGSRIAAFAADGKPVIFFTRENGAFVIRGAMNSAWDKLGGATGKLGAPIGDQTVHGDVISQKFTGGKVSWNKATNTFTTEPASLSKSLSGLQVPGQNTPSKATTSSGGLHRHWWWVWVAIAAPAVAAGLVSAVRWWRQRRRPRTETGTLLPTAAAAHDDDQWSAPSGEFDSTVRLPSRYSEPREAVPSAVDLLGEPVDEPLDEPVPDTAWLDGAEPPVAEADEDPDAVDTTPNRIPEESELRTGRHAAVDHGLDYASGSAVETDAYADDPLLHRPDASAHAAIHLPLADPYQAPDGYPVKGNVGSGLFYTAENALYDDTLADIWFASEEAARLNGFIKAR